MENNTQDTLNRNDLENFFLNSNIDINIGNFIAAILLSLILAYLVKFKQTIELDIHQYVNIYLKNMG